MRAHSLLSLLALGRAIQGAALEGGRSDDISPRDVPTRDGLQAREGIGAPQKKPEDDRSCPWCSTLLSWLKANRLTDTTFRWALRYYCTSYMNQDEDVCDGWVNLEVYALDPIIKQIGEGSRSAHTLCSYVFGTCGLPDVAPWNVTFPSPKPARGRPEPSRQAPPLKIVHFSDIHVDPLYTPGSRSDCTKPICCRPYTAGVGPGNNVSRAGPNGDHKCDSPHSLEASMYEAINALVPDAAFALFTGDIVDHASWLTTQDYVTASIEHSYAAMKQKLKLVYGTAGNHDVHPVNVFQPRDLGTTTQWVYDLLSKDWAPWLDPTADTQVTNFGAYSTKYQFGNLRIISLNTNFYLSFNFWLYEDYDNEYDVEKQLDWLIKELDAAEQAGENVYIIGHGPVGERDTMRDPSNYLDQIFNRYSATIAGMFFGHTHRDQFEVSYLDYAARNASNAFLTSYIAPSLTPTSGMPAFRVYSVDPKTFGVLDVTTYIADMTNPSFQETGPVWSKYYTAKEAYGAAVVPPVTEAWQELTPSFWHNVTEAFDEDEKLFGDYIARKSRGWNVTECAGACKTAELCQLRAGRSQDNCYDPLAKVQPRQDAVARSMTARVLGDIATRKDGLEKLKELVKKAEKNPDVVKEWARKGAPKE